MTQHSQQPSAEAGNAHTLRSLDHFVSTVGDIETGAEMYRRLGFRPAERRLFNDENDCLVHRLDRADWAASRASVA